MAIRGLIFDLDGLIIDTETPAFEAWRRVFAEHGCHLDLNAWLVGLGGASGAFDGCAELAAQLGHPVDRQKVLQVRQRLKAQWVLHVVVRILDRGMKAGERLLDAGIRPGSHGVRPEVVAEERGSSRRTTVWLDQRKQFG